MSSPIERAFLSIKEFESPSGSRQEQMCLRGHVGTAKIQISQ